MACGGQFHAAAVRWRARGVEAAMAELRPSRSNPPDTNQAVQ